MTNTARMILTTSMTRPMEKYETRQPWRSVMIVTSGMRVNCPTELPMSAMLMAMPRNLSNHLLVIAAIRETDGPPNPKAATTP